MTTRSNEELLDTFSSEMLDAGVCDLEDLAMLATALAPIAPSKAARDRLLASVAPGRFDSFAATVSRIMGVAMAEAKSMLDGIDVPKNWVMSPVPAARLYHVTGGVAVAGAATGFIRMQAGDTFPEHTHLGREIVIVVQGSYRDEDGTVVSAGDVVEKGPDTTHSFVVLPGPDLVYLGIVWDGLEVAGQIIRADDPRI